MKVKCLVVEAGVKASAKAGCANVIKYEIRPITLEVENEEDLMEAAYDFLQTIPRSIRAPRLAWNWWVIPEGAKSLEVRYWGDEQIIGFSTDGSGTSPHTPTSQISIDLSKHAA